VLPNSWNGIAAWALGTRLRRAVVRYAITVVVILAASALLPADTLRDSRVVLPFLVVVACAWFGGVGPGIVALFLVPVCFKYRANGFPACFEFSRKELSTLGALLVVTASVGWAGALRRRSQAIARQQAIELRELHRRKDEFLATLAHELRNPLAPLRSGLDVLRLAHGRAAPGFDVGEIHDMMQRQVDQLVRLIDDLLEVSRINTGRIELRRDRLPIAEVIRDAVETSRPHLAAAHHALSLAVPDSAIVVDADRARLTQVVTNLLNNAAKFTAPGGRITLAAACDRREVRITVRDSGIGISSEMLPRVFDMFAQVSSPLNPASGGLGIGLSLARAITELHGGRIEAFSEGLGKGSEFVVTLPEYTGATPRLNGAASLTPAALQKGRSQRILIVDDNIDGARSLAMLLSSTGHQCHVAGDGESALEAAPEFDPDVFLLDIGMPTMSGYELARRLRAMPQFRHSLLIAVTGWGKEEDREKSRASGFDSHLVKPVSASALGELLTRSSDRARE
jgi:signal transduction histidine kinase/ActR/RegA family two-component response regulator